MFSRVLEDIIYEFYWFMYDTWFVECSVRVVCDTA